MKFTFDPATGQYRDEKGRIIDDATLRRIQADSESSHIVHLIALAIAHLFWRQRAGRVPADEMLSPDEMFAIIDESIRADVKRDVASLGPLTSAQYQIAMNKQIELSHLVNEVLGAGGIKQTTLPAWREAERIAATQKLYAGRLAAEVDRGLVSPAQTVNRAGMYAEATYATFSGSIDRRERARGVIEARRILDPDAEHCEDCPDLASDDWHRITEVAPIGESACRSRCRCWIEYRRESAAETVPEVAPAEGEIAA